MTQIDVHVILERYMNKKVLLTQYVKFSSKLLLKNIPYLHKISSSCQNNINYLHMIHGYKIAKQNTKEYMVRFLKKYLFMLVMYKKKKTCDRVIT